MTTIANLQQYLTDHKFYTGEISGNFGPRTSQALQDALAAGPDTPLDSAAVASAAASIQCSPAQVRTVWKVEAAGAGFANGLPKILFEGHIFSKLTKGVYDASHPGISYPHWDKSKYPATQAGRYAQLLEAVALNPDAAFQAASYGAFQILGENYAMCGFKDAFSFVMAMCQSEGAQLLAFCAFVKARHIDGALRSMQWITFAVGYNGSAQASNNYSGKLAAQYKIESQR